MLHDLHRLLKGEGSFERYVCMFSSGIIKLGMALTGRHWQPQRMGHSGSMSSCVYAIDLVRVVLCIFRSFELLFTTFSPQIGQ